MFKKIKIALGLTGLLLAILALGLGDAINRALLSVPVDIDWMLGSIVIASSGAVLAILCWVQQYDRHHPEMSLADLHSDD